MNRRSIPSLVIAFSCPLLAASCGGSTTGPGVDQPTLVSIEISPELPFLEPGDTLQFSATGTYDDNSTADVTQIVAWTSSDTDVLTISNAVGSKGRAVRSTDGSAEVGASVAGIGETIDLPVWCTELATGQMFDGDVGGTGTGFGIGRLAADSAAVYWAGFDTTAGANGGFLARASKDGGGGTSTLRTALGAINDLVSDGAYLYWTEYDIATGEGAIKRLPVDGGTVEELASGNPPASTFDVFFPSGIAVAGDFVYWGEEVATGAVRRVSKTGGPVTDLARGEGFGPTALIADGTHLYGVANKTGQERAARIALADGSYEELATGLGNPEGLALDGTSVYWSELVGEPNGRIAKTSLAGGTVTALATGLDNPRGVAVVDGTVYYAGAAGAGAERRSGIWSVPVGGGTPALAVGACGSQNGGGFSGLVADSARLYFVELGSGGSGPGRVLTAPRE